jgi:adenylate kinase
MNIVLLGPPGSGKSTQAKMITNKYRVKTISTGDILRKEVWNGTPLGKEAKKYMDAGKLVPDTLLIDLIKNKLAKLDVKKGWMLDGYPRTVPQAEGLEKITLILGQKLNVVLNLDVPDRELVQRLSGRRICRCEETNHVQFNPPKESDKCDICHGYLYQRDDDKPKVIKKRLEIYRDQTKPLIDYYSEKGLLVNIKGSRDIKEIFAEISKVLDKFSIT